MSRLLTLLILASVAVPALAQDEKKDESPTEKLFRAYSEPVPVGDFLLQERAGSHVRPRDLRGKIWVAQFFYPGCNRCSRNTPTMQRLQEIYRGKADVCLVSIALRYGDLATLQEFAKDHQINSDQWLLLTGDEDKVHEIVQTCFFETAYPNQEGSVGDEVVHATYLLVIDHAGNIVGKVDGTKAGAAEALQDQIERLRIQRRLDLPIPISGGSLPWFNAMLNSTCTVLLLLGWIAIRLRYVTLHKMLMLSALAVSTVFLASYLFYHFVVMEMAPTTFRGEGAVRYVYFSILLSHTILAIVVAPLALYITVQGLRNALAAHVKMARWTLPIWLYVSVTGVVVYWMLYRVEW